MSSASVNAGWILVDDLGSHLRVERPGEIDLDERHGFLRFRFRGVIANLENFERLSDLSSA
jgi:hypothetical protein